MPADLTTVLVVAATVAVAAAVQGAVGFGMNLLAVPVLLLVAPQLVPGPLLIANAALGLSVAAREHEHIDRRIGWALLGRVPGSLLALVVLLAVSSDRLALPIAGIVLLGVALVAAPVHVRPSTPALLVTGTIAGFTGTTATIDGPPMALLYSREPGPALRSTLAVFFLAGDAISLTALTVSGVLDGHGWLTGAALVPAVVVGRLLSTPLARHLDAGRTRPAVLVVSAAAAVLALVSAL